MASLFVSHSSRDRAAAERICAWLQAAGFTALFVDFDPEQGIPAGRNWERELYAQLRRADAVVFLASAAAVVSQWCFAEVSLARSLRRPIFPVRLQPGVVLPLLADVQWVELVDGAPDLARLQAGMQAAGLDPATGFGWDPRRSPYPGLAPFVTEDAAVFFGREPEADRLVELVQPTLARGPGRWVAVVGPSGSGKSSLLRAGLLARLARQPERWVLVPPLLPGTRPTHHLAVSLAAAFADRNRPLSVADLEQRLADPAGGSVVLVELAGALAELAANGAGGTGPGRPSVLLVVDQAEELVTRSGVHEQQAFLRLLAGALGEDSPLWVVATLRSEFLSTAPERAGLAEAVDDPLVIEPLSRARLAEVIARPAQRAGLEFEAGLVERMVEDAAGGDALPMLAYTLRQLAERAGPDGGISLASYETVGGVVGALQHQADRLADELARRGHGPRVIPTLLKLVTVGPEGEPTRRRVQCDMLSADEQAVVNHFVDARLLTSGENPENPAGKAMVEVAHEALLRQWPPLRQAIEDARSWLRLRAELDREAADWQQGSRDESYLLRGGRLAAFEEWANQHFAELGPRERDFIQASRALASRELEASRRSNRRLHRLVTSLGLLLVVALISAGVAVNETLRVSSQRRLALSRQLALQAERLVDSRPDTAILLGLQSLRLEEQQVPPLTGLVTGLARLNHTSTRLNTSGTTITVDFSPDGRLVATAVYGAREESPGTLQLWDIPSGTAHGPPLYGHSGHVNRVAFSPRVGLLASASVDQTVRLWDVSSSRQYGRPLQHPGAVTDVAFDRDGTLLATAGGDDKVRLWEVPSGKPHGQPLNGRSSHVNHVAFSPKGGLFASAGADGMVSLWDVSSWKPTRSFPTGGAISRMAFSPDEKLLATAGADKMVRLWDLTGAAEPRVLAGHTDEVWGVAFSPNGPLLATASLDQTVRLWELPSGEPYGQPLRGHGGAVFDVKFSPDGKRLASAGAVSTGEQETVRLWDVNEVYTVTAGRPLLGHNDVVSRAQFSPDGRLLASASADQADQTVRLWKVPSGEPYGQPLAHSFTRAMAFSRDGRLLTTASTDAIVRVWDVSSGTQRSSFSTGHSGAISAMAFGGDDRLLAIAGADAVVRLWDLPSRTAWGSIATRHFGAISAMAFSPDGRLLATAGGETTVRVWDVSSNGRQGELKEELKGHRDSVNDVAFSPDGRLLATAGADHEVRLWEVLRGRPWGTPLTGNTSYVNGVAFSRTGRLLASAGADRSVRVWEVSSGKPYGQPFTGHTSYVNGVVFSPDEKVLASASADRSLLLWNVGFTSWRPAGCQLVGRNLSSAEWESFAQGLRYQRTCPEPPSRQ